MLLNSFFKKVILFYNKLKYLQFYFDFLLCVVIATYAFHISTSFIENKTIVPGFYQHKLAPAVLDVCGRGFNNVDIDKIKPLSDFLHLHSDSFNCSDLPLNIDLIKLEGFQSVHLYLFKIISFWWSIFDISWDSLLSLYGLFYACSSIFLYMIFRLGINWYFSFALTLFIAQSQVQLVNLPHLRDYSKTPFFFFSLYLISLFVLRNLSYYSLILISSLLAIVLGIGIGFRMDIMIFLYLYIVVILFFTEYGLLKSIKLRIISIILFFLLFNLSGYPIIKSLRSTGTNSFHPILLGLMTPFDYSLGIERSFYDLGHYYNDSYIDTVINSYSNNYLNIKTPVYYLSNRYSELSSQYFIEILKLYPFDIFLRILSSIVKIITYFGSSLNIYLFILSGFIIVSYSIRYFYYYLFIILFLCGLPALQFHERHFFHLEFIHIYIIGLLLSFFMNLLINIFASKRLSINIKPLTIINHFILLILLFAFLTISLFSYQTFILKSFYSKIDNADVKRIEYIKEYVNLNDVLLNMNVFKINDNNIVNIKYIKISTSSSCNNSFIQFDILYSSSNTFLDYSRNVIIYNYIDNTYYFPAFSNAGVSYEPWHTVFSGIKIDNKYLNCIKCIDEITNNISFPVLPYFNMKNDESIYHNDLSYIHLNNYYLPFNITNMFNYDTSRYDNIIDRLTIASKLAKIANNTIIVNDIMQNNGEHILNTNIINIANNKILLIEGKLINGRISIYLLNNNISEKTYNIDKSGIFKVAYLLYAGKYTINIANDNPVIQNTNFEIYSIKLF